MLMRPCSLSLSRAVLKTRCVHLRPLSTQAESSRSRTASKRESRVAVHSASFVQNVFRGIVEAEQPFPYPQALNEEQRETLTSLVPACERFVNEINDPLENDALETVPESTMNALKELGAFGMQVPMEHGGLGLTNTQYGRMCESLGVGDLGLGIVLGAHQSIGFKGILIAGSEEQKAKYLPALASGDQLAAFALTEPSSGSDASSIRTRAELSPDGSHYLLNGSKVWISNGGLASVFTVFAKTAVRDEASDTSVDKVTAFIVEREFGGLTHGPPEKKMGIKCSNTAEVYFDNVPVPKENVLGGVGNGFKVAMQILNNGRFGMAAALSGNMRAVIGKAVEHANNRRQFGHHISEYGAIREKIARMAARHYVTESMAYMVSGIMDKGYTDYQLEAALSKIYSSESAWFVADEAIQILGGMGYMRHTGLEKVMRDLRIFRIFEGTNDILRLFVALTGIQYAGGHLRELQRAVKAPISNFGVVMNEVTKRGRSAMGLGGANLLASHVHPNLERCASDLCTLVEMFGGSIEKLLIKHGKDIINEQFLLNRIAEATINIYAMVCVISRCSQSLQHNLSSAMHEESITKAFCLDAVEQTRRNLTTLRDSQQLSNFKELSQIAQAICDNGGVVQSNPIGI